MKNDDDKFSVVNRRETKNRKMEEIPVNKDLLIYASTPANHTIKSIEK